MNSGTPPDLAIHPRNVLLGRGQTKERWWKSGDPVATAFYNSLSAVFPVGEQFFIDSVRHYRESAPPNLQEQIDAFTRQEAVHSREHAYLNDQIRKAGYDLSSINADLEKWKTETKDSPPEVNLAITVALEHFTAILAHVILKHDRHFKHDTPEVTQLWKWHAMEEIEHKGVAFDTFLHATKDLTGFQRWRFRSLVLLVITWEFLVERIRFMSRFFRQDRINTPWNWIRAVNFLLIYPGVYRQILPAWLAFFRPRFHPWNTDDRELITRTEAKLNLRAIGA